MSGLETGWGGGGAGVEEKSQATPAAHPPSGSALWDPGHQHEDRGSFSLARGGWPAWCPHVAFPASERKLSTLWSRWAPTGIPSQQDPQVPLQESIGFQSQRFSRGRISSFCEETGKSSSISCRTAPVRDSLDLAFQSHKCGGDRAPPEVCGIWKLALPGWFAKAVTWPPGAPGAPFQGRPLPEGYREGGAQLRTRPPWGEQHLSRTWSPLRKGPGFASETRPPPSSRRSLNDTPAEEPVSWAWKGQVCVLICHRGRQNPVLRNRILNLLPERMNLQHHPRRRMGSRCSPRFSPPQTSGPSRRRGALEGTGPPTTDSPHVGKLLF